MRRIKRSKALSAGLIGAAVLSVGTVGFSAWVITGGSDTDTSGAVGVKVAAVTDLSVEITNLVWSDKGTVSNRTTRVDDSFTTLVATVGEDENAYLCFGPKASDNAGFITSDGGTALGDVEHMTLAFSYTIQCADFTKLSTFTLEMDSSAAATALITASGSSTAGTTGDDYIINPFSAAGSSGAVTLATTSQISASFTAGNTYTNGQVVTKLDSKSDSSATFTTTLTWRWGAAYSSDNKNPSLVDSTSEIAQATKAKITSMNTVLGAATDNLTFTLKVAQASA